MSAPVGRSRPPRRLWLEIAGLLGAALGIFCLLPVLTDRNRLHLKGNDCFQYLSMAGHIAQGHGVSTSLLHYQENYRAGTVPAPQTVFPPGYPLVIAALELVGVPGETAGVAVSLAAFAAALVLVLYLGRLLHIRTSVLVCVLVLLLGNGVAWALALRIYAESLFTAATLLSLTLFLKAEGLPAGTWPRLGVLAAAAAAAGASYWVRYAGCFLIATVACYFVCRWLLARSKSCFADAAVVAVILAALVLPLWLRNLSLVGSVQGGNPLIQNKPLVPLGKQFVLAWLQLLSGFVSDTTPAAPWARVNRGLTLLGIAGILLLVAPYLSRRLKPPRGDGWRPPVMLTLYIGVYLVGISYVARHSNIDYEDPRMFLPVFPVVLLSLASLFPTGKDNVVRPGVGPALRGVVAVTLVCYCVGHAYGLTKLGVGHHQEVRQWLAEPVAAAASGAPAQTMSLAAWLVAHVPADAVLLAPDGQQCGFVLQRPCVTAPFPRSDPGQHEAETHALASQLGATYFLLFTKSIGTTELCEVSPFFVQLVAGRPPAWLVLAARTDHCRVYRTVEMKKGTP